MKNSPKIQPLIDNCFRAEYMVGSVDTAHGTYRISFSEGLDGDILVTLTQGQVVYVKTFPTTGAAMDAILTFESDDKRFKKVGDSCLTQ